LRQGFNVLQVLAQCERNFYFNTKIFVSNKKIALFCTNKTRNDMNATSTIQAMQFDTMSVNIPKADLALFKELVKRLGWKISTSTSSEQEASRQVSGKSSTKSH